MSEANRKDHTPAEDFEHFLAYSQNLPADERLRLAYEHGSARGESALISEVPMALAGGQMDTTDAAMLDWLKANTNVANAWRGEREAPFSVYWGDRPIRQAVREAMIGGDK